MASKLKDVNINIDIFDTINEDKNEDKEEKKEVTLLDVDKDFKNIFNPNFTIVYLNCSNYSLIKSINKILKGECRIIVYISDQAELIKAKKRLNKKNIIVLSSKFEINNLKSHIVDIIFCENILGSNGNNLLLIKEVNRVLKQKGHFIFFESIFLNKSFHSIKSFYKKRIEPKIKIVITGMIRKLKIIKNSEYDINISGTSNFIYNSNKTNTLNNFYDFLIDLKKNNKKVVFNKLNFVIKGTRGI